VRRDDLSHAVRTQLKRLPPPFESHYGVVPLPPPEGGISLACVQRRHSAANAALVRVRTLAAELEDPYLISRILPRREAVSSSSIEGTHSTLDELLSIEETLLLMLSSRVPAKKRTAYSGPSSCRSCTAW
jgi:hypothetical protein